MKNYEDFIDGLQQDVDIPKKVWSQYEQTLEDIVQLSDRKRKGHDGEMMKRWMKTVAAAGILVACGGMFFYGNPVAASKIPVIGKIFEQVREDITYSGSYEEKETLQVTEQEEDAREERVYMAKSGDVTITASEIYCDGYSVYLTAKIESEQGGFDNIPAYYTRRFEEKTSQFIHTDVTWEINEEGKNVPDNSIFEGKSVDDKTFIGMLKLDCDRYLTQDSTLHLKLSELLYDDINALDADSIEPASRIKGDWELTIPFTVDKKQCREIPVNKKNADGYGIRKVFVSPYQVIVFSEAPYTTLSPDAYTQEDFEEQWDAKNKEIIENNGKAVTYDAMLGKKFYALYELAMYNQDGEALEMQYCDGEKTIFAVQEHELSKLHIYMGDESVDMGLIKAANEGEAKENAMLDATVDLR